MEKIKTPWSTIGYIVAKRTYARRTDPDDVDSRTEEWDEVVNRVVTAAQTQLGAGFTPEEEDRLRSYMLGLKGTVAGRFLWQLGTPTVERLGLLSLQNCFAPETEFMTDSGIKSFNDFDDGDTVVVRGRKGWKEATVKNFGESDVVELEIGTNGKFKKITTTLNHRWVLKGGLIKTTAELAVGDTLASFESRLDLETLRMCPVGIQHGFVYGDGHKISNGTSTALTLVGDSIEETQQFFPRTDATMMSGLPYFFKDLPDLAKANAHYLFGFLAGWFAADGCVAENGCLTIANKSADVLDWARGAFSKIGLSTGDVHISREFSPFDGSPKPLYRLNIRKAGVPKRFLLLRKHSDRYKPAAKGVEWKVKSVSDVVGRQEVWCVVEPEQEEFTLACGVLTKNCAFTVVDEPVRPFTWAMDALMLGSGVGYNIQRENVYKLPKVRDDFTPPVRKDSSDADFILPDTREGWVKLLEYTLRAAFEKGARKGFSYSTQLIRGKGAPIKGFGGVASGPEDLVWGIEQISKVIEQRKGKQLRPIDCLDIFNIIGAIVVAGNVRRSAQIAIGDPDDLQFLRAKNWASGNIPNWRANSNNSVVCNDISTLPEEFWKTYDGNSEPYGLINLKLSRAVGRLGDTRYKDKGCMGYNPCAEQSLNNYETCCLAEIFLPYVSSYDELVDLAKLLYRINKHSLRLSCHHPETQAVVWKNMRMGIGVTGYLQASEEQRSWLADCYEELRKFDVEYSTERGWPASIKLTTCKPSGTLSLLPGTTSGVHPAIAQYMIRRVRISSNHPLVDVCRDHGYHVEYQRNFDDTEDRSTVVVEFPFAYPEGTVLAKDLTAVDQLEWVKRLQTEWSDNSVSCTVYYRPEELAEIRAYLEKNYNKGFKSLSFLLHSEHGFKQAPFEEITKERYEEMVRKTRLIDKIEQELEMDGDECAGGACPIR